MYRLLCLFGKTIFTDGFLYCADTPFCIGAVRVCVCHMFNCCIPRTAWCHIAPEKHGVVFLCLRAQREREREPQVKHRPSYKSEQRRGNQVSPNEAFRWPNQSFILVINTNDIPNNKYHCLLACFTGGRKGET